MLAGNGNWATANVKPPSNTFKFICKFHVQNTSELGEMVNCNVCLPSPNLLSYSRNLLSWIERVVLTLEFQNLITFAIIKVC